MFTGIVVEKGKVLDASEESLVISGWLALEGAQIGDSIAVNGACLTITTMSEGPLRRRRHTGDAAPHEPR